MTDTRTDLEKQLHASLRKLCIMHAKKDMVIVMGPGGVMTRRDGWGACDLCMSRWPPGEEQHKDGCLAAPYKEKEED